MESPVSIALELEFTVVSDNVNSSAVCDDLNFLFCSSTCLCIAIQANTVAKNSMLNHADEWKIPAA